MRAALARAAALRAVGLDLVALLAVLAGLLLREVGLAGFLAVFDLVAAEPAVCPVELDELTELWPPTGTAAISRASTPARHRVGQGTGIEEAAAFMF